MSIDAARTNMIEQQIRPQKVTDRRILNAISQVPREDFVPDEYQALAFAETTIPLSHGQVMLTPSVEAQMLDALALTSTDIALEIGTGSGFFTACMAKLCKQVVSVDCFEDFTLEATEKLRAHHIHNATLVHAQGENGWPESGPYDAIVITGSLAEVPEAFKQQLAIGGRLVCIVGDAPAMTCLCVTRVSNSEYRNSYLFETVAPRLLNTTEHDPFEF